MGVKKGQEQKHPAYRSTIRFSSQRASRSLIFQPLGTPTVVCWIGMQPA